MGNGNSLNMQMLQSYSISFKRKIGKKCTTLLWQQVLTKENRISTDFCNLLFLMQNFIKIVLGFFLIDFGFLNVSAYFLNIIIKIPTLIWIKGDIFPISFKSTLSFKQRCIYTENQMQCKNILVSNICDLVCMIICSTVRHPEAKLMRPHNDKVSA